MATATTLVEWVSKEEVARILGVSLEAVLRLEREGHLTVRRLPLCHPRYRRDVAEALAAASTREASKTKGPNKR